MTRILSVETSGDYASAAAYVDGSVFCRLFKEKNRHTESLITLADKVLGQANLQIADMDAIAFGAGPGAFTGLRVACGIAQGLAWAIGKPTVAVGNLAAAAYAVFQQQRHIQRLVVVNDARMHECYTACFQREKEGDLIEVRSAELVKPEMLADYLVETKAEAVVGTALGAYPDEIVLPESVRLIEADPVSAEEIVKLAAVMFDKGQTTDPHLAAPLYVRNRVALTIEQRRAGEKL